MGRVGWIAATRREEPRCKTGLGHSEICGSIKGAAILAAMVARKTVCLRRLAGNRKGELQCGRFFANRKVTAARIIAGWSRLTGEACAGRHVLAIEDRTEVKFPTTAQRRRGLGPVKKGNAYGVEVCI